ncbi:hypothetical protein CPC08DRAFT_762994 [Agrocybe pediades]|nr:hypothetical protein CPC08DRAFT_762994 [Agrocybe pediades]
MSPISISILDADSLKVQMLGTIVSAIVYGMGFMLYIDCFSLLLRQHRSKADERVRNPSRNMRHFLFFFITLLILLATLAEVQAIVVTTVSIFGGPRVPGLAEGAPLFLPFSVWSSDSFMLWRCATLYQGIPRSSRFALLAFICLVFLASLGSGISIFMDSITQRLPILLMVSFSTFLNIIICAMIILRLTFHQRYLQTVLGPGHGSPYNRVKAMSVESASLLIALGIPFVILVGTKCQNGSMFLLLLYPQICAISPILIVYRVAQGRAAMAMPLEESTQKQVKDIEAVLGSIQFKSNDASGSWRHSNPDSIFSSLDDHGYLSSEK